MGGVEVGFLAAARRFAGRVRAVVLVLISAFGLLAVPGDALPLGLGLLAVVLVGAVADSAGRAAPLVLVFAVARVLALSATQGWTGAQPNQWALNALTITAITVQWEWRAVVAVPVTAVLLAGYLAGAGLDAAAVVAPRLVAECSLAQLGFRLLRRSSRRVDRLRARQAELAGDEAVAVARQRREREYLALLHDTASATFLVVAAGAEEPALVAEHARRDLAALTGTAGAPTTQDSEVDLAVALRSVVSEAPVPVAADLPDGVLVPASVALAVLRAVGEALVNVHRHARVPAATLCLRPDGDRVVVTVRDDGVGFAPADVPPSRRGIRGSIVERLTAVGGSASTASRPGAGTTVRLVWPDA